MIPRLVSETSPLDAFCDVVVVAGVVGIGDSRSWIVWKNNNIYRESLIFTLKENIKDKGDTNCGDNSLFFCSSNVI